MECHKEMFQQHKKSDLVQSKLAAGNFCDSQWEFLLIMALWVIEISTTINLPWACGEQPPCSYQRKQTQTLPQWVQSIPMAFIPYKGKRNYLPGLLHISNILGESQGKSSLLSSSDPAHPAPGGVLVQSHQNSSTLCFPASLELEVSISHQPQAWQKGWEGFGIWGTTQCLHNGLGLRELEPWIP